MCFQHKAVMIFERVFGVDHPDTLAAYVSDINYIVPSLMCQPLFILLTDFMKFMKFHSQKPYNIKWHDLPVT